MKKNTSKYFYWLLAVIVGLGFLIRVFQLDKIPAILNRDEAALAYNAFLLSQTGQDEWGRTWPLALESFGDYKLPGYPALLAVIFKILPANDWLVRLPSALAGSLLILLAFLYARSLRLPPKFQLLSATTIALLPVYIFYSHMAFESNLALCIFSASLYLLFFKTRTTHQNIFDFLAVFLALLSIFTYNTPFLLLPFVLLLLPLHRGLKKFKDWILPTLGLLLIFALGVFVLLPVSAQKSGITIFSDETVWRQSITYRAQFVQPLQATLGHKYLFYLQIMAKNFLGSFSPTFLVTQGGAHPWHSLPNYGHFYWSLYLLIIIGIGLSAYILSHRYLFFWQKKKPAPSNNFSYHLKTLLYLTIISLLPSIITVDSPHTTRSLFFFFFISLLAIKTLSFIYKKFNYKLLWLGLAAIFIFESSTYLYRYFIDYPQHQPVSLRPGFESVIKDANRLYADRAVAIVDDGGYQYISTAWYLKLDPQLFLSTIIKQDPDRIGFRYGQQVANYHFIAHPNDRDPSETVLVFWQGNWQIEEF